MQTRTLQPRRVELLAWLPVTIGLAVLLPSGVVDAVSRSMKMVMSYVAENILYGVGYPVSRTGGTLQVSQYMLLVADACAYLHTLLLIIGFDTALQAFENYCKSATRVAAGG